MRYPWPLTAKVLCIFSLIVNAACSNTTLNTSDIQQVVSAASDTEASSLVLAKSATEVEPIKVGQSLPTFSVLTATSEPRVFSADNLDNTTVIVTYRGGWCPYCNVHLQELRKALPKLEEMGVETVFFSGDRPEILLSSLQEQTQKVIAELPYQIYSDANLEAASALGVAFEAKNTKMKLLQFVKDTKGSSLDKHSALAVPAVFIVDANGIIQYTYFNSDYTKRLSADDLLQQITRLM